LEVASVVLPALHLPDWALTLLVVFVVAGFPLALILAWAFEMTPEGLKREAEVDRETSIRHQTGRKFDFAIIGLLVIAVVYFAVDKFVLKDEPPFDPPVEREKSIAVLPFANISPDPEDAYFADGIHDEVLAQLAKIRDLKVISRTSVMGYRGEDRPSLPEIAAALGVANILEGSVRLAGNRVRITVQLIEAASDAHLWAETYDRELEDIFAVQDEIAANVAEALKVELLGADSKPLRPSVEISPDAYSDYLLARQKLTDRNFPNLLDAERLLKGVIENESEYPFAYSALAETYRVMAGWGVLSLAEASERMMSPLEHALSLDNQLAEVWKNLAFVRFMNGDSEGARKAEDQALELEPQNPVILDNQISRLIYSHEPERALVYADELLRVDPLSLSSLARVGDLYGRLGRFDDMETVAERTRRINPESTRYPAMMMLIAIGRGDLVKQLKTSIALVKNDTSDTENHSMVAITYLDLGNVVAAQSWNDEALRIDSETPWARMAAALLHLYHNEEKEAVAIARKFTESDSGNRNLVRGICLRIGSAPDLAAGNYEDVIARYVSHFPELADGVFPAERMFYENSQIWEAFIITLDLASAYLRAGEEEKGDLLLSLVESELPHWPTDTIWGSATANVELYALRGEKEAALAALREHVAAGLGDLWRFQLLYNPNLESIRDTPEFAAIVAEIEADMAEQLERVREMERNGELEPIPEVSATSH